MRVLVMIGIRSGCLRCSNTLQIKRSTRPGTKEMAESTLLSILDKEISATESNDPTRNECTNCHLVTRIDSHRIPTPVPVHGLSMLSVNAKRSLSPERPPTYFSPRPTRQSQFKDASSFGYHTPPRKRVHVARRVAA